MGRGVVVAGVVAALVLPGRARAQSRDPEHYQVIAQSRAQFKGLARLDVNVAVDDARGFLNISPNSKVSDGYELVADRVRVMDQGRAFDVFANRLDTGRSTVIAGTVTTPVASPIYSTETLLVPDPFDPVNYPPDFPIACGTGSQVGAPSQDFTLPPGVYGSVRIGVNGTLHLGPGVYQFCSLIALKQAKLSLTGPVTVNVRDLFLIGSRSVVEAIGDPSTVQVNTSGPMTRIGTNAIANLRLFAPHAKLRLGGGSSTVGHLVARRIISDAAIHVSGCGNGVLDSGEACDPTAPTGDAACPGACIPPTITGECTCSTGPTTTTSSTSTTTTTTSTVTTSTTGTTLSTTTTTSSTAPTGTTGTTATTSTVTTTSTVAVTTTSSVTTTSTVAVTTTTSSVTTTSTIAVTTTSSITTSTTDTSTTTSTTQTSSTTTVSTTTSATVAEATSTSVTSSTTTSTIPCGDAQAFECNGLCDPGFSCIVYIDHCLCAPDVGPCGSIPSPICGGECPEETPYCVDNNGDCVCSATP